MIHLATINLIDSTTQIVQSRISSSWPWYIIRASGFTAAAALILLTLSGIGQVTGFIFRFIEPIKAWAIHKALAFALCGAIAVHGSFLLIDHFVKFTPIQIVIPLLNRYNNGVNLLGVNFGWFAIASGIIATYGIIILVISSLKWIDTKKSTWKKLHYLSYLVAILVFIHALSSGSDLKYGTFRAGFVALGVIIVLGVISRVYRSGLLKEDQ